MRKVLLLAAACAAALVPWLGLSTPAGAGDILGGDVLTVTYQGVDYQCTVTYTSTTRVEPDGYGRTATFFAARTTLRLDANPECAAVLVQTSAAVFYRRDINEMPYQLLSGGPYGEAVLSGHVDGVLAQVNTQHGLIYRCDNPPANNTFCTWSAYVQPK